MTGPNQPERRCLVCAVRTVARSGICRSCNLGHAVGGGYTEHDALIGGKWVPRDGIMRWEPTA